MDTVKLVLLAIVAFFVYSWLRQGAGVSASAQLAPYNPGPLFSPSPFIAQQPTQWAFGGNFGGQNQAFSFGFSDY